MSGLTDSTAEAVLAYVGGQAQPAAQTSIFLGLFTTAPTSDAGSGGTEVTGGSYARQQVAGSLAITGSTSTASTTFTLSSNAPQWLVNLGNATATTGGLGVTVWSSTGVFIGTIATAGASTASTTVTLQANAAAVASGSLQFSAFSAPGASTGNPEPNTLPSSMTNGASILFPQATASWGNVTAFGLFTLVTAGTLLAWDYLGNFKWLPFTCSQASPGVLTTDSSADAPAIGASFAVTQKYGGTLPTLSGGSWSPLLTAAGTSGATWNVTGNNTSSIGGGQFRQVLVQAIAINVTASFAASALTITSA